MSNNNYTILIADDNPDNIKVLSGMFHNEGYKIHIALNGEQVLASVESNAPDIILLDIQMPKMDGFETCRQLKSSSKTEKIPIIFISAMNEKFNKIEAFSIGGLDYITKPFILEEVKARVHSHLSLYDLQRSLEIKNIKLARSLRSTFEQSAVGMVHVSLKGEFLKINSKFCQITGYSEEELFTKKYLDLIDIDYKSSINMSESNSSQYIINRKDYKNIWVKNSTSLISSSDDLNGYLAIVIEDITESKKLEENMLQRQKMDVIGSLASGISNDMNNVLSSILTPVQLIKSKIKNGIDITEEHLTTMIKFVEESGSRAVYLINRLLTLSKKYSTYDQVLDLNSIVFSVFSVCDITLDKSVKLVSKYYQNPAMVKVDRNLVEQLIFNLCINATHSMTIMRDQYIDWGGELKLSINRLDNFWEVVVKDGGVGINKDSLDKIYDPFFTTKSEDKRVGLGLFSVYNTVQQYKGSIEVESELNVGTTFKVYIPICEEN